MAVALGLLLTFAGTFSWPEAAGRAPERASEIDAAELVGHDDSQRVAAVLALASEEPGRARARLVPLLRDRDPAVRAVAARLLARRGAAEAIEAATAWLAAPAPRDRLAALQVLRDADQLTPAARRAVERALADGDVAARLQAIDVLSARFAPASFGPLLSALDDEHRDVRARAARALGATRDARAALPLVAKLSDGDRQVQLQALAALGALGDRRVVPALVRLVGDGPLELRAAAVDALGRLGDAGAVKALLPLARRGPQDDGARRALGQIGTPEAVEGLLALARVEPVAPDLRDALEVAAPKALARLGDELTAGTPTSARLSADVLGRLGDRRATAALVGAAQRPGAAAPAVLAALARLADPASVPALARIAADDEVAERRVLALDGLAAIGDDRALVVLPRALADAAAPARAAALRLAASVGVGAAAPQLPVQVAALLNDVDADVRREAALALARLCATPAQPPPSVASAVLAALTRARPSVTDAAALSALGDALERLADGALAPALERAYLSTLAAPAPARAALARGLAAAHGEAPLVDAAVIEALLRDLAGDDQLAGAAADALVDASLSATQAGAVQAAFARAGDDLQARLAPTLGRSPGGTAQLLAALRDPDAAPSLRAAAAWTVAGLPEAHAALVAAAAQADGAVAANARAALAAGRSRGRAWVAARVVGPDGAPWARRWIVVSAAGGPTLWTLTDLDGRARVRGLPDGAPAGGPASTTVRLAAATGEAPARARE